MSIARRCQRVVSVMRSCVARRAARVYHARDSVSVVDVPAIALTALTLSCCHRRVVVGAPLMRHKPLLADSVVESGKLWRAVVGAHRRRGHREANFSVSPLKDPRSKFSVRLAWAPRSKFLRGGRRAPRSKFRPGAAGGARSNLSSSGCLSCRRNEKPYPGVRLAGFQRS